MKTGGITLITTHTNADFDGLASLVCAGKLYPDAYRCFSGSVCSNVKAFLEAYPQGILKSRSIKLETIERLILVDTREKHRIGKFGQIADKTPLHIYDHHPSQQDDLSGEREEIKEEGATITILLEILRKKEISITKEEATLFALGIYEDTGSLLFPTTSPSDIDSLSWLFKQGADLSIVSEYLEHKLTKSHLLLLSDLFKSCKLYKIRGVDVAFASAKPKEYIEDLASVVHQMMDIERFKVLFCFIETEECIHIIARSRTEEIGVGSILSCFGGGGHGQAGSATVKGMLTKIQKMVLANLKLGERNLSFLIEKRLPKWMREVISILSGLRTGVYLVGGFVRDLILNRENLDLDLVVTGDGIEFAKKLSLLLPNSCLTCHHRFGTAQITLENKAKIDIAGARKEAYAKPGALPEVSPASLKSDLKRRDFTINTLAISANPKDFGRLIDFYGGITDIQAKIIRILHPKSFVDDPTRIFRAVRFSSRFGFAIEKETEKTAKKVARGGLKHLSYERLRNELILILSDEYPEKALNRLSDLGALGFIWQKLRLQKSLFSKIHEELFHLAIFLEETQVWVLWFLALTAQLNQAETEEVTKKLNFCAEIRKKVLEAKTRSPEIIRFLQRKTLKNSTLYKRLINLSDETLIFALAKTKSLLVKKRIHLFFATLKKERVYLTGDDLISMGLKPGPKFRKILNELLSGHLDGKIKTKEDELR
ncbi:MAG: DHH family phosphoesterase, partial [Candidatus Desantisbacteria bacterium]